jgi:hypothetical protein
MGLWLGKMGAASKIFAHADHLKLPSSNPISATVNTLLSLQKNVVYCGQMLGIQWRMQEEGFRRSSARAKYLEATPILFSQTHSEAHCLLNQQGLGWPAHQFNRWSWK